MKRTILFFLLGLIVVPSFALAQVIYPNRGGTGTSTAPTTGQVLVGQSDGTYGPQATSTLGISGGGGGGGLSNVVEDTTPQLGGDLDLNSNDITGTGDVNITGTATSTYLAAVTGFNFLGTLITNVGTWFSGLFDTYFAAKDTGDLAEGSNLYYTIARVSSYISSSSSIPSFQGTTNEVMYWNGSSWDSTATTSWDTDTTLSEEQVEDFVGGMLGGTQSLITVNYQDGTNDIDFVVDSDLSNYSNTTSAFFDGLDDFTGTLTDGKICVYDEAGAEIDCTYTDLVGSGGGLATTTDLADTYALYATGVNTLGGEAAYTYDDAINLLTVPYASTTGLSATNLYGTLSGNVTGDLTGNADTATALAANGSNCSAGSFPLGVDASGASESCTDAWTEAENTAAAYTPQSRTITVAGTSLDITSSAGAQDLSANRTWTLNLDRSATLAGNPVLGANTAAFGANGLIFEGTSADNFEALFSVPVTTSDKTITFQNVTGTVYVTGGTDVTVADGGTGASTLTQGGVLYGNGTGAITNSGVLTNGQLLIGDGTTFPTVATLTQGTGMTVTNGAGSITLATTLGTAIDSSEITNDTIVNADINSSAAIAYSKLSLTDSLLAADLDATNTEADDDIVTYDSGTGGFTFNSGPELCVAITGSADLCDGSDDGSGGGGGTLSTTTDKIGAGATSTVSYVTDEFMLGGSASTSAEFLFDYASSSIEIRATGVSTTTVLSTDTASSTRMGAGSQNSDDGWFLVRGVEWVWKEATAILRSAGTLGVTAIETALNWTIDGTLTLGSTLTFDSQTFDSFTDDATLSNNSGDLRVVDVNCTDCLNATEIEDIYALHAGDAYTGNHDFGGASFLEIPNGTNPTADDPGELAHDTTDNQLILDDFVIRTEEKLWGFTLASTSIEFVSGGVVPFPIEKDAINITEIHCYVDGGTSIVFNVSDGTNDTETVTCTTSGASDTDITTNDTFTAGELAEGQIGTITGTPDYLSVSVYGTITRE